MYSFRNRPEKLAVLLVSKARTNSLKLPTMFTPGIRAHGTVAGTYKSVAYLLTMHVYCVYQKVQTTFYFWKIAETSGLLFNF
jgi:hypothetical protein